MHPVLARNTAAKPVWHNQKYFLTIEKLRPDSPLGGVRASPVRESISPLWCVSKRATATLPLAHETRREADAGGHNGLASSGPDDGETRSCEVAHAREKRSTHFTKNTTRRWQRVKHGRARTRGTSWQRNRWPWRVETTGSGCPEHWWREWTTGGVRGVPLWHSQNGSAKTREK